MLCIYIYIHIHIHIHIHRYIIDVPFKSRYLDIHLIYMYRYRMGCLYLLMSSHPQISSVEHPLKEFRE